MTAQLASIALIAWLVGVGCCGCTSYVVPRQDFAITLQANPPLVPPESPSEFVLLAEVQEITGTVDSWRKPDQSVRSARLTYFNSGEATVASGPTKVGGIPLFWSYDNEHVRWTFFSPGYAARTIYPQDVGTGLLGETVMDSRLPVISPFAGGPGLSPEGWPVGERFSPEAKTVRLEVPMRPVRGRTSTRATTVRADMPDSTREVEQVNPSVFDLQVSAVLAHLRDGGGRELPAHARAVLWNAVAAEWRLLAEAKAIPSEENDDRFRELRTILVGGKGEVVVVPR